MLHWMCFYALLREFTSKDHKPCQLTQKFWRVALLEDSAPAWYPRRRFEPGLGCQLDGMEGELRSRCGRHL